MTQINEVLLITLRAAYPVVILLIVGLILYAIVIVRELKRWCKTNKEIEQKQRKNKRRELTREEKDAINILSFFGMNKMDAYNAVIKENWQGVRGRELVTKCSKIYFNKGEDNND